ncbi:chromosome segregation protein SMC [Reichenbachiella carrageenanivorans]|uniref:Chromosome partition protein Smc n=2 Tax=Reichenbachiella TaxID=156993 RepID=A0ABY6CUR4_9BACT|nr:chromosome segregation protein SMC [Reichenbachiella carrageenanivorans]UXX77666.1 chromosome segregation protein SMC [Reichenbachiella carrageenanivorans]
MQLTKLEIKGFKSFGDKVVINFDEGITGIVGPNGCGKSNVVDSIRWVLGEQKVKSLRSEKMDNIIFNGTKNRKPTQLAEVSLSFKNTKNLLPTEYSNVTITRRYYRSGESEYQLNGVTCRLKDITSLFLDTGIASNSYAIIELGMVDNILNDKDNSRRGLFEEAAGISKFKIRKKETLKKLNDTDADLDRVEDLLFEIDKNLKSLERQAKQAQKYYQVKEDYKTYSVQLAKQTLQQQKEKLEELKKASELNNDKKTSLNKQLAEKEAQAEKSKADLVSKEKTLASRQKTLNEHVNKIRQYESEKKIKNERLRFLNGRSDSLKEIIEQDRKSSERASFSVSSLSNEKISAEKILNEIFYKLETLKQDFEEEKAKNEAFKNEGEELNQNYTNKKEEVYQLIKSLEIKSIQVSSLKQELEKAATDTSSKTENLQNFEKRIAEIELEKKEKQEQYDYLKSKDEELKNRITHSEKTIEVIREELTQVNRKLDASQNEYNLTKSLVDNLEGFPEAIKFLKKETSWSKNAPLLSDVLTCPEEYRVTVENYLESYMNYYIVDTEAEAFKAINILSDASKGKAHFFILDRFEKFKPSHTALIQNAVPATEVVEYDPKYKKLIGYILDNVYISNFNDTEGIEHQDTVLITKSGKVIDRQFSISGGSVGLFEGKRIGRAKNLEKLSTSIKKLTTKLNEVKANLEEKVSDLNRFKENNFEEQLEQVQTELAQIKEEHVSFTTKQEQFANLLTENTNKSEDILEKINELNEEIAELSPKKESEQKLLEELELRNSSFKEKLVVHNEQLNEKSAAFNQENILYHQQQNKVSSIIQEITHKEANLESAKERIEKNQSELKQTDEEVRQLVEKSDSNDDQLIEMYEEKESIETAVTESEKAYYAERELIETVEKEAREIQREREQTDASTMEVQNELNETRLKLSGVKERLSVEFNIDIDQLLIDGKEDEEKSAAIQNLSEEEIRAHVEKLKNRMDTMGPINPMAMEAYEEIKERHDFIVSQKEDLLKAKESLMETISEIDAVAKGTFLEAFESIKTNFIRVFRSLFTEEDQCDLRLSNPDDPLESAIEIMAKPKGKRPLSINQLSGGEKTLTATSLLFAIYLLKPAPFCIFDEVDAPLDDANIDKFNNIIRDFSNESQFIIVTHNKRTMISTDVIYGVTMVEQGVSRVVPVDLKELD